MPQMCRLIVLPEGDHSASIDCHDGWFLLLLSTKGCASLCFLADFCARNSYSNYPGGACPIPIEGVFRRSRWAEWSAELRRGYGSVRGSVHGVV